MRTWRFWAEAEGSLELEGVSQLIRARAGSNVSEAEAREEALRRLAWVQQRVTGRATRGSDGYEADIREEVLDWLGDGSAITRNRYGAHVLNVENLPILDVDDPPRRFQDWFTRSTPERRLDRMTGALRAVMGRPECAGLGFRLYATAKGFRIIVLGRDLPPGTSAMEPLVRRLHVDRLFWTLCRRQVCYRARLTPKPYRMRIPTVRVPFPATPEQQADILQWEEAYLEQAQRFSTCRFLAGFGVAEESALVHLHDQRTGAFSGLPLA